MNREEAITALGDRNNLLWGMSKEEKKYYSEALDMAISALSAEGEYIKKEDALAELNKWEWQELYLPIHFKENILNVLPTYSFPEREKGEWIPCSEKMPKDGQSVNVTVEGHRVKYVTVATWDGMRGEFYHYGLIVHDVVAWRELPEPYEI